MNPRIFLKQDRHTTAMTSLQWRHNEPDGVSNHQPHDYLLNRYSRRRSRKTPKLRVTGLWEGNSPVTGEFPAQRASDTRKMLPFGDVIMVFHVMYFIWYSTLCHSIESCPLYAFIHVVDTFAFQTHIIVVCTVGSSPGGISTPRQPLLYLRAAQVAKPYWPYARPKLGSQSHM